MNCVLHLTAKAPAIPRAVTVLSYASMRLRYPGDAPTKPAELAACIRLLRDHPWMREPAFEFLSAVKNSAWPLLIAEWAALEETALEEIGLPRQYDPDAYAPRTFSLMREIVARQCDKAYCGHHVNQHARTETGQPSHCAVEGCKCGFFLKGDR
jgi:hypothetical protein